MSSQTHFKHPCEQSQGLLLGAASSVPTRCYQPQRCHSSNHSQCAGAEFTFSK